ncbi:MAG: hypothetical protein EAX81_03945 [Candidatus Thorarchaeota archaeon]|nr:hypothetical protein [Candidatus Thorarchaeota archaeon]
MSTMQRHGFQFAYTDTMVLGDIIADFPQQADRPVSEPCRAILVLGVQVVKVGSCTEDKEVAVSAYVPNRHIVDVRIGV